MSETAAKLNLSYEEEACLKTELIGIAVDRELRIYFKTPTIECLNTSTVFLRFLRSLLLDCPWLRSHTKTIDELFILLPELCQRGTRATAVDWKDVLKETLVDFLNLMLVTSGELHFLTSRFSNPTAPTDSTCEKCAKSSLMETISIWLEHEEHVLSKNPTNSNSTLIPTFRMNEAIGTLPSNYQAIFQLAQFHLASLLQASLDEVEGVYRLKAFHNLFPLRSLQTVLKATRNPVSLLNHLLSLFFVRPFRSKSLFQRQASVFVNLRGMDPLIKSYHKQIGKKNNISLEKLQNLVAKSYDDLLQQIPVEVLLAIIKIGDEAESRQVLTRVLAENPLLTSILIQNALEENNPNAPPVTTRVDQERMRAARLIFWLLMRKRDKQELINLLGSSRFVGLIKQFLFSLEQPLRFLGAVDLAKFVGQFHKFFKQVAEHAEKDLLAVGSGLKDDWDGNEEEQDDYEGGELDSNNTANDNTIPSLELGDISSTTTSTTNTTTTITSTTHEEDVTTESYPFLVHQLEEDICKLLHDISIVDEKQGGYLGKLVDWLIGRVRETRRNPIFLNTEVFARTSLSLKQIDAVILRLAALKQDRHIHCHPSNPQSKTPDIVSPSSARFNYNVADLTHALLSLVDPFVISSRDRFSCLTRRS